MYSVELDSSASNVWYRCLVYELLHRNFDYSRDFEVYREGNRIWIEFSNQVVYYRYQLLVNGIV